MGLILLDLQPLETAGGPEAVGGKAANLARLSRLGYRIPEGVVLPGSYLEDHLRRCGLAAEASAILQGAETGARAEALRARIEATPLAAELVETLAELCDGRWSGGRIVVRSSAVGEDAREHSFAGQLDSVLNVAGGEAAARAVRRVWASLWSERCLAYQRRRGVRLRSLAVILCRQVEARFAGVLFTRAPGRPTEMLAEYCPGLGDKLVSGGVTPGSISFDRETAAVVGHRRAPDGPDLLECRDAVASLASGAAALERSFGEALDLEWAIDAAGNLFYLQARPITEPLVVWSNANIAENFPDVVSPMLLSIARRGYSAYFENLGLGFGISKRRIEVLRGALDGIVGAHAGRLYYNLTNIHALLHLAPGGRWLSRFFNEFTGATHAPPPPTLPRAGLLESLRVAAMVAWQYAFVGRRIARFEATVEAFCSQVRPESLGSLSLEELGRALDGFLEIRLRRWNDAALGDTAAMVAYGLLQKVIGREGPPGLHNTLLKGLSNLASGLPVAKLWALSRRAREHQGLSGLLAQGSVEEVERALATPEFSGFAAEFRDYLERWGFRSSRELMLTAVTPPERPGDAIALLMLYAGLEGPSPDEQLSRQSRERQELSDRVQENLTASRAVRFRLALAAAHGAIRLRERARFKQALLYTRLRRILLAIGSRLVERGSFGRSEDVFFLTVEELQSLISGRTPETSIPDLVSKRRSSEERLKALRPPDTLVLSPGEVWDGEASPAPVAPPTTGSNRMVGTGACGGRFQGRAAVLADSGEASRLSGRPVLVTRQTDPGWAAVFFLARGLVVERGGMLSHGAIIAREYGIPAVVGVAHATTLIRDQDEVSVDGDRGVVEILGR